jgi:ribosomal-protein-alanine N-acetyltransferase
VSVTVRLVSEEDVEPLTALLRMNRDFLEPYEPAHEDDYFSEQHQRELLTTEISRCADGRGVPLVILDEQSIVGRINILNIVRRTFQSAQLGYWVDQSSNGRGVASAAVRATLELAFGELGLHRVEAATLLHNERSQRVLRKNGFSRIGLAGKYLRIAGRWQDHILFQRVSEARED